MTALTPLIGQPDSGPERSCSALRLISKQVRLRALGAWLNCQPSSDNNGETVSRSCAYLSILRLPWRNVADVNDRCHLTADADRGYYIEWESSSIKEDTKRCGIAIDAVA